MVSWALPVPGVWPVPSSLPPPPSPVAMYRNLSFGLKPIQPPLWLVCGCMRNAEDLPQRAGIREIGVGRGDLELADSSRKRRSGRDIDIELAEAGHACVGVIGVEGQPQQPAFAAGIDGGRKERRGLQDAGREIEDPDLAAALGDEEPRGVTRGVRDEDGHSPGRWPRDPTPRWPPRVNVGHDKQNQPDKTAEGNGSAHVLSSVI